MTQEQPKRCFKCQETLLPDQPRIILEGGVSFHPQHFTCDECGNEIGPSAYKKVNSKFYCTNDYYSLYGQICSACQSIIKFDTYLTL